MRPPRIAILVLFTAVSLFIIYRGLTTNPNNVAATYPATPRRSRSVFGFMYYNTPFSLFPPNAAISLTDDNSTSFAARPAAFGPKLAYRGLSGQLWVGSGFGEDGLDTDGELGCSDIPGWGSPSSRASLKTSFKAASAKRLSGKLKVSKKGGNLLDPDNRDFIAKAKTQPRHAKNDNTDDYLTEELSGTLSRRDASSGSSAHADIQSIQEAAEIEGKVVLLKRGGCGFLEKVMWAQRRGAVAVIVGDNQKGGPLIQMFAHGDEVDNVTVPSVFTARTTAQLLSSLTQPGSFIEDTIDDNGNPVLKVQQSATVKYRKRSPPRSEPAVAAAAENNHADLRTKRTTGGGKKKQTMELSPASSKSNQRRGILSHVSKGSSARPVDAESRPPRSGRLDWVLVEDWNDEKDKVISDTLGKTKKPKTKSDRDGDGDGFVIGVHDWRDPDLVGSTSKHEHDGKTTSLQADTRTDSSRTRPNIGTAAGSKSSEATSKHRGLMSVLFGVGSSVITPEPRVRPPPPPPPPPPEAEEFQERPLQSGRRIVHEGLWVTITPSSSASPFFDTLLVLVISPLVTLTVVYALLILRAKIRRRRCRAPKSVVDQLPVRTYHTVSSAVASSMSPRLSSPTGATPTTPLLQHSTPISRSRPRSRTTTGVLESPNFLGASPTIPTLIPQDTSRMSRRSGFEKGAGGFSAEWRKYMGRQVECVVCLEEYVDGVSRVMRLPCGHEFHADCITPWLTTRRRTCPICKGDVVRSMQRGKGSGPRYEPFREGDFDDDDDDDDDDEEEEEEVGGGSGSGTGPAIGLGIGIGSGNNSSERVVDLEQGPSTTEARNESQPSHWGSSWLDYLSGNFHARTRAGPRSPSPEHGV
ncbi:hypothetical protein E4U13_001893 [Claviceps humidiphila]|uniref:RING-type domain-containing protein n=1 Tax=Claviceps humidiphila TaxID=1294629 RepID=A0A9P7TUU7_9HYPO|nr:hypothetical protein E4U13_001893 [Claviceps humidiphila]